MSTVHHAKAAEQVRAKWPKGTRVSTTDDAGFTRTGTVNGLDVGIVVEPGFTRPYVGVDWDRSPRGRSFTSTLTRLDSRHF